MKLTLVADNLLEILARGLVGIMVIFQFAQLNFKCTDTLYIIALILILWMAIPTLDNFRIIKTGKKR